MPSPDPATVPTRMNHASPPPGRWRSSGVFVACTLVAGVLVVSGLTAIERRAVAVAGSAPEPPVTTSVMPLTRQSGYERKSWHAGLVEPGRQTDLAFETGGTLVEVLVEEGDRVSRGEPVARLDTRALQAERASGQASRAALLSDLERSGLALRRQRSLHTSDFTDGQSLDDARLSVTRIQALIEQADARIEATDVALDKSVLRAPFDAEIGRQSVDEGTAITPGTVVASLFEWNTPTVRVGLPVEVARSLDSEYPYTVTIDDVEYPAVLLSRRRDVSARTRTVDVRFALDATEARPRPAFGQTATLRLAQRVDAAGYRIPLSALSEGDAGLWSVLLALPDESGAADSYRVAREHVTVLYTDGSDAFVQGRFPDGAPLIRSGTHRIVTGQRVRGMIRDVEVSP